MSNDIREVDNNAVAFYSADGCRYPVFYEDNTFWTTQKVMGMLFDVETNTIVYHLQEIFKTKELDEKATTRKFRVVQNEGGRKIKRDVLFYNLDGIIAVGYRVNSRNATAFRQWATETLRNYVLKNLADRKDFRDMSEDQKRLAIRREMTEHNKSLAEAAKQAGINEPKDYAVFQDEGYKGLYGGLGQKQIHQRKGLKKSYKILDFMGSTELAANFFRVTQTDEKLRREGTDNKTDANIAHRDVGKKVRQTIKDLGGTMPEDLPTPEISIQKLEREQQKQLIGPHDNNEE